MGETEVAGLRRGVTNALVAFLIALGVIGIALLAIGLYPADLPLKRNPDFIDIVFDNRGVIWAARLLLVSAAAVLAFGGLFIVASTGIRMKNREWLRRAGPFEISETAVSEVERQLDQWRIAARARQKKVDELTERLDESEELIAALDEIAARSLE